MSTTIYDATLAGVGVHAQVGDAIQAASERIAIDEAPTVTLTLLDPQKKLLERVDLWNQPKEAPLLFVLGERSYGFVQLDKQPHRVLRATFESTVSLKLRAQQSYRKAYRKRITRLAFCQSLCREAGVKFHAPEAGPPPPLLQPAKGAAAQLGGGFEAGAKVTVKAAPASTAQLATISTVLGEVFGESAPERVAIAVVMAATQESTWNTKAGLNSHLPDSFDASHPWIHITPSGHYGLFQQSPRYYSGVNWFDPVETTRAFLKRFLPVYHANPGGDLGALVESVQRAGLGSLPYDQWEAEATLTVAAFTHPGATRTLLLNDKFEFSRGQPHQPETSWDALGRILSEIGWRRFVVGDTLWAASDEWLFATPARATLIEDTGAVEDITWSLDAGKPLDRATVTVDDSWVFSPGVVVRLENEGSASGKWLLATWERDLLQPSGTLELVKPGKTIPEPVGDQTGKGYKPDTSPPTSPPGWEPGAPNRYGSPFSANGKGNGPFVFAGVDQGTDWSGAGSIYAIGDCLVTNVSPQNSGTGWPGAAGLGTGALICYQLTSGNQSGKYIYLAENVDPANALRVGQRVRGGTLIAKARGAYPYIETGWAADAHGHTLASVHGDRFTNPPHPTADGQSFYDFLKSLGVS